MCRKKNTKQNSYFRFKYLVHTHVISINYELSQLIFLLDQFINENTTLQTWFCYGKEVLHCKPLDRETHSSKALKLNTITRITNNKIGSTKMAKIF